MSFPLGYSDYNSPDNNNESSINKKKNKTLRRREPFTKNSKVQAMKEIIEKPSFSGEDDDDNENLANFDEYALPKLPPTKKLDNEHVNHQNFDSPKQFQPPVQQPLQTESTGDDSFGIEGFNGLQEGYSDEYTSQFVPYYQNAANVSDSNTENSELKEKLNYLIHLIEEQKDEKVGHVTEELILYSFLGVFVIYVVDSFARVGKYVR